MSYWCPIPVTARDALTDTARYTGRRVTITDRVPSDTWLAVKKVLEKLGATYVVGGSAFDFEPDLDARHLVDAALTAGGVIDPRHSEGFVPTPPELAADLVDRFGLIDCPGGQVLTVLDPSAGKGALVSAITRDLDPFWMHVDAVEPDARRAGQIRPSTAVTVHVDTFEAFSYRAQMSGRRWDRVVMNPPFSVPGDPKIWERHLLAAWDLLAPGGRLVAIVPSAAVDDRGRPGPGKALVRRHGGWERLDHDAFAKQNVSYGTAVVWLDRLPVEEPATPYLTPDPPYVFASYTGDEVPVRVARPFLTRGAADAAPVQVWYSPWTGGDRVLRYAAQCVNCRIPVWLFDDGNNDPRGVLGDQTGGEAIEPPDGYPRVALCAVCGNSRSGFERAEAMARALWAGTAKVPAQRRPVEVEQLTLL